MYKHLPDQVVAFDVEWVPDPISGRRIYALPEDMVDEEVVLHHCPRCGCTTHYTCTEKVENKRVVINCRMMNLDIMESIPVKRFDGAVTWSFLED